MSEEPFQVTVTIFRSAWATVAHEERLTLHVLADRIVGTSASAKASLPWLKLALFGKTRTPFTKKPDGTWTGGCLRHDANVQGITGIEGDYDQERIAFQAACEIAQHAGLLAIVYTSPSHTDDTPRWRVLCPLSVGCPPEDRDRLMGRLNGLYGGVFSGESWTLSQSYYYGSVNNNPSHRVEVIDGTPINLLVELDAGAIGKPASKASQGKTEPPTSSGGAYAPASDVRLEGYRVAVLDTLRREAVDAQKHFALLRTATTLGGVQAAAGFTDAAAISWMLDCLPDSVLDWNAAKRTAADGLARGRAKPIQLLDRPHPNGHASTNGAGKPPPPPEPPGAEQVDPGPVSEDDTDDGDRTSEPPPPNGEDDYGGAPHQDDTTDDTDQTSKPPRDPPADDADSAGEQPHDDPPPRGWAQSLDFFADTEAATPELRAEHLPAALWPFVQDTSARMGVDPTSMALAALVSCASVISDEWRIQPKCFDTTWTENPRLWAAIIGDPSILKTPVIAACTRPIDRLDVQARERHQEEMREYKAKLAAWKVSEDGPEPRQPKLARYIVEGSTIEALSEVLRDDDEARQHAPAKKVLSRHDEMAELIANLDRYRTGGRGGGDRGAYLRLYNGGRHTIDRIGRGSFAIPNWSACLLGGIQPGPIQRIAKAADDDGLLQRFMYSVAGKQLPGLDRMPDAAALQRYEALFPKLSAMHPRRPADGHGSGAIVLHQQAHQHREDIDALARALAALPDTSPRLRAAFGKWPGLFARLCLTFHLIDVADARGTETPVPYLDVVPEATARRVASFMYDIVLPHLLRAEAVMFSTAQTTHARWIAGYILAQHMDRITTRDIVRAYRALSSPEARDELAAVMDSLVTINWLEPEVPKNRAKPVSVWAVNPAVHTTFKARAEREREARDKARERIAADIEVLRRRRREAPA